MDGTNATLRSWFWHYWSIERALEASMNWQILRLYSSLSFWTEQRLERKSLSVLLSSDLIATCEQVDLKRTRALSDSYDQILAPARWLLTPISSSVWADLQKVHQSCATCSRLTNCWRERTTITAVEADWSSYFGLWLASESVLWPMIHLPD